MAVHDVLYVFITLLIRPWRLTFIGGWILQMSAAFQTEELVSGKTHIDSISRYMYKTFF